MPRVHAYRVPDSWALGAAQRPPGRRAGAYEPESRPGVGQAAAHGGSRGHAPSSRNCRGSLSRRAESAPEPVPRGCRLPFPGPRLAAPDRACPVASAQPTGLPRLPALLPTWGSPVRVRSRAPGLESPFAVLRGGALSLGRVRGPGSYQTRARSPGADRWPDRSQPGSRPWTSPAGPTGNGSTQRVSADERRQEHL